MAKAQSDVLVRHVRGLVHAEAGEQATDGQLLERFIATKEEVAFGALVWRHGPMVLSVAGRTLQHAQDAEDVFQAAFLLLARKAAAIRQRQSVASWLHGVTLRLAARARGQRRQRYQREKQAASMRQQPSKPEETRDDLSAILNEALQHLPEKYRTALILCHLEGKSHGEASRQLGCPLATLRSWLVRGRKLLRTRLARRGLVLSAEGVSAVLLASSAGAAVPRLMLHVTTKAALAFASGGSAAAIVSLSTATLVEHGAKALAGTKIKLGLAFLLTLGVLAASAGVVSRQSPSAAPALEEPAPVQKPESAKGSSRDSGQVQVNRVDRQGDPLPSGALARLGSLRYRNADEIASLAFTPDGKWLITGGYNGTQIWELASGKAVRQLGTELPHAWGPAALSPDGKLVAVGGWGPEMGGAVYERATGRRLCQFGRSSNHVVPACFSPDGKILAACYGWRPIDLYDPATGKLLRSFGTDPDEVRCLAFTADGKTVLSGGPGAPIRFWNVATGKEIRRLTMGSDGVGLFALSPDNRRLAVIEYVKILQGGQTTSFGDTRVHLFDVASAREEAHFDAPGGDTGLGRPHGPNFLAFTPDGKEILTGGVNGILRVCDSVTGKELRRFTDHAGALTAIAIAPGGKAFAVAECTKTARLRELATGRDLVQLGSGHRDTINAVAVSPNGRTVATTGEDGVYYLWDASSGRELQRWQGSERRVQTLLQAAQGQVLFSSGYDKKLRMWNAVTGQELRRFPEQLTWRMALASSPDSKSVAMGQGKAILLLKAATGEELRQFTGASDEIAAVAFSADGRTLHGWSNDSHLHQWEVATARPLRSLQTCGGQRFNAEAFSPDGRYLAFGGNEDYIGVLEVANGQERSRIKDLPRFGGKLRMVFSPDGRTLAWCGSEDGLVRLSEVATGAERARFAGHRSSARALAFAPDGKFLVSAGDDTTALVWDLTGRSGAAAGLLAPLSEPEMAACWEDLADPQATRAYVAVQRLVMNPARSVPFLAERLLPVRAPAKERLAQLIADLDSNSFQTRQRATAELEKIGDAAAAALHAALAEKNSLEMRQRVQKLVDRLAKWTPVRLRGLRALEALEGIRSKGSQQVVGSLAQGAAGAWLTEEARSTLVRLQNRTREASSDIVLPCSE